MSLLEMQGMEVRGGECGGSGGCCPDSGFSVCLCDSACSTCLC